MALRVAGGQGSDFTRPLALTLGLPVAVSQVSVPSPVIVLTTGYRATPGRLAPRLISPLIHDPTAPKCWDHPTNWIPGGGW